MNCGAAVLVSRRQAVHTRWNSCATPIAATCARPLAAARFKYGAITSALRSSLANLTHGMSLASAKEATARRNFCPILSKIAGEGIGRPRCWVMNATTCPLDCRIGT